MKELDSFTVERLEEIRNSFLDRIQESAPSIGEVFALIDIALAVKRAEPVGYWNDACDLDDGAFSYANDAGCTRPLYTTPQLNSQVPLGSWINCIDQMPEDDTLCLGVDEYGVIWTLHFYGEFRADTGWYDINITHWMPLPAAPEKPV